MHAHRTVKENRKSDGGVLWIAFKWKYLEGSNRYFGTFCKHIFSSNDTCEFSLFIQLLFKQEATWDLNLFTEGDQHKKTHQLQGRDWIQLK